MKTQHTPGPWEIIDTNDPHEITIGKRANEEQRPFELLPNICFINTGTRDAKANAKLIAAAPDMLKALESIRGIEAWIADKEMKTLFQERVYGAIQKATE